jgi:hypothetical protein
MAYETSHTPVGLTEEDERTIMVELRRQEVGLEERRLEAERKRGFWEALQAIALIGIPIATFFGLQRYFRGKSA